MNLKIPVDECEIEVIIHFRSTNLTHAQMIESHADFASDVTILFNNNLF
jgi:hypothetical protein